MMNSHRIADGLRVVPDGSPMIDAASAGYADSDDRRLARPIDPASDFAPHAFGRG
jgi:hypothetical protein